MTEMSAPIPPPVLWAQRSGVVFLTFCVEDCKDPTIEIEADKVFFKGIGGAERKPYEVTINLFEEVDPEASLKFIRGRNIEIVLKKKQEGRPYWNHLTKEKTKQHWLKVDFNRWQDEDGSEDEMESDVFEKMMRSVGGGDGKPKFDDFDVNSDSDDEEFPVLDEF